MRSDKQIRGKRKLWPMGDRGSRSSSSSSSSSSSGSGNLDPLKSFDADYIEYQYN